MDALTWFKSVFQRGLTTPAPLRADLATEEWADVPPLHLVAARLRPRAAAADDDDQDWDAVIARAKVQAAAPSPPHPPLPRRASIENQVTPPPTPRRPPPPSMARSKGPRANLDLVAWGGVKKLAASQRGPAGR